MGLADVRLCVGDGVEGHAAVRRVPLRLQRRSACVRARVEVEGELARLHQPAARAQVQGLRGLQDDLAVGCIAVVESGVVRVIRGDGQPAVSSVGDLDGHFDCHQVVHHAGFAARGLHDLVVIGLSDVRLGIGDRLKTDAPVAQVGDCLQRRRADPRPARSIQPPEVEAELARLEEAPAG